MKTRKPKSTSSRQRIVIEHVPFRTFLTDDEFASFHEDTLLRSDPSETEEKVRDLDGYKPGLKAIDSLLDAARKSGLTASVTKRPSPDSAR